MATFFSRKTGEEAVDAELGEAQRRFQQHVVAHPQLQASWEQHAETCTAAKEGLVFMERKEDEKDAVHLYGKSDITVACSCKQIMYTFDEKGNLKIQEEKQNTETGYATRETSPSSLYRDNQK